MKTPGAIKFLESSGYIFLDKIKNSIKIFRSFVVIFFLVLEKPVLRPLKQRFLC